jgi:prepilin-type N-terminal cleavage/methylation domain-containing protein
MYTRAGIDHLQKQRKDSGFTLIEVMFAVVFLSIGLLGIAAMQDIAISRNVDGRRLTVATNLAAEMLERVRYNAAGNSYRNLGTYLYHNIIACTPATFTPPAATCPFAPLVNPCPASFNGNCTGPNAGNASPLVPGGATALGDYNQWRAALAAVDANGVPLLPGAIGTVAVVAVDNFNPIGPTSLELVQTTVTVGWVAGLRTPTITMSTVMAPL